MKLFARSPGPYFTSNHEFTGTCWSVFRKRPSLPCGHDREFSPLALDELSQAQERVITLERMWRVNEAVVRQEKRR